MPGVTTQQQSAILAPFTHVIGAQPSGEFDAYSPSGLIRFIAKVGQRLGLAVASRDRWGAKPSQRIGGHDPRGNRGGKATGQERSQRCHLPPLNVPCRPIVEQAKAAMWSAASVIGTGSPSTVARPRRSPVRARSRAWRRGRRRDLRRLGAIVQRGGGPWLPTASPCWHDSGRRSESTGNSARRHRPVQHPRRGARMVDAGKEIGEGTDPRGVTRVSPDRPQHRLVAADSASPRLPLSRMATRAWRRAVSSPTGRASAR